LIDWQKALLNSHLVIRRFKIYKNHDQTEIIAIFIIIFRSVLSRILSDVFLNLFIFNFKREFIASTFQNIADQHRISFGTEVSLFCFDWYIFFYCSLCLLIIHYFCMRSTKWKIEKRTKKLKKENKKWNENTEMQCLYSSCSGGLIYDRFYQQLLPGNVFNSRKCLDYLQNRSSPVRINEVRL
jgi:hypothetical protein